MCDMGQALDGRHCYLPGWLFHRGIKGKKPRVAHSSPPRTPPTLPTSLQAPAAWVSVGLLEPEMKS